MFGDRVVGFVFGFCVLESLTAWFSQCVHYLKIAFLSELLAKSVVLAN